MESHEQQEQAAPRLGDQRAVISIAGIKKSEIWRRVKAGRFPAPVKLGPRCTRWNLVEVEDWARQRLAEREKAAA